MKDLCTIKEKVTQNFTVFYRRVLNEVRYHEVEVYLYGNRVVGKCFDDHVLLLANDQQRHRQMEASAASLPFKK